MSDTYHEWQMPPATYADILDRQYPFDVPTYVYTAPASHMGSISREFFVPNPDTGEPELIYDFSIYDTYIHTFDIGKGKYDHIYYRKDGNSTFALPLHHPLYEKIREQLVADGFPHYHSRYPDQTIFDWHKELVAKGWDNLTKQN